MDERLKKFHKPSFKGSPILLATGPTARLVADSYELLRVCGETVTLTFDRPTLLIAVKSNCDGCQLFYSSELAEFEDVRVVLVVRDSQSIIEIGETRQEIFIGTELLSDLKITWPPFYALVELGPTRVVTEGVAFDPVQVAREIAKFRST